MKQTIKSLVLAAALALPPFFSGNAFAIPGCGKCAVGTAPASHATFGVTNTTRCSTCHTTPAIPASPGKPTTPAVPAIPATPGINIYPTSHSCSACLAGTAPSSVSAHKNVNANMTACSVCHGATGGTTNGHSDSRYVTAGGHSDDHQSSPGNSDFGHSHKHDKKQHRGNDN